MSVRDYTILGECLQQLIVTHGLKHLTRLKHYQVIRVEVELRVVSLIGSVERRRGFSVCVLLGVHG